MKLTYDEEHDYWTAPMTAETLKAFKLRLKEFHSPYFLFEMDGRAGEPPPEMIAFAQTLIQKAKPLTERIGEVLYEIVSDQAHEIDPTNEEEREFYETLSQYYNLYHCLDHINIFISIEESSGEPIALVTFLSVDIPHLKESSLLFTTDGNHIYRYESTTDDTSTVVKITPSSFAREMIKQEIKSDDGRNLR